MLFLNRKFDCLSVFILCCLLETSLSSVHGSAAAAPVVEEAAAATHIPLKPMDLVEFRTDKTEEEVKNIVKAGLQAKLAKKIDLAIGLFEEASRYGSMAAMAFLGSCYEIKDNSYVAFQWYQKAVDQEKGRECVLASERLSNPEFMGAMLKSRDLAFKQALLTDGLNAFDAGLYVKEAEYFEMLGTPDALYSLGLFHMEGKLGQVNFAKAAKYFEMSGAPDALCGIGIFHMEGKLGEVNFVRAAEYFKRSGLPSAWFNLGIFHMEGKLGEVNFVKAAEYFERSSLPDGLYNIGIFHMEGKLGEVNFVKAAEYFERSSLPDGLYNIGIFHMLGKLGEVNFVKAASYFERSGTPDAWFNIGVFYRDGLLGESDFHSAIEYFERSGQAPALYSLFIIYNALGEEKIKGIKARMLAGIEAEARPEKKLFYEGLYLSVNENYEDALKKLEAAKEMGEVSVFSYIRRLQEIIFLKEQLAAAVEPAVPAVDEVKVPVEVEPSVGGGEGAAAGEASGATSDTSSSDSEDSNEAFIEFDLHKALEEQLAQKLLDYPVINRGIDFSVVSFKNWRVEKEYNSIKDSSSPEIAGMLQEIQQNPWSLEGLGKPEILKHVKYDGRICFSRRLSREHRLVYTVDKSGKVMVLSCKKHYKGLT
jgi:Txe/YoeB family toxin of toxin-antitoxin system